MRDEGVKNEKIQSFSYYAMNVLRDSTRHLFEHFYRDYLVERIEHEVENSPQPDLYPLLALEPEQRAVSKGKYVLTPDETARNALKVAADWIMPWSQTQFWEHCVFYGIR
ncbi:hypothetical protein [Nitrosomonas aestuarii]|uniref:hypothetical protein n=1 Tax=Nitrosomonas aestuarii TaxID=52441 RepID=UPI000D2FE947|nr:hypothetical protein [Nitrosomonas aestuarii]PTN10726.1 hypothetical protein C8R11_11922 [Nitrosomonas aestuarii]